MKRNVISVGIKSAKWTIAENKTLWHIILNVYEQKHLLTVLKSKLNFFNKCIKKKIISIHVFMIINTICSLIVLMSQKNEKS
ncbi:hypothetical protein MAR_007831 [Mya arenaria]|uniref:Uncharacterized protein n=1 Tax=Mya arenaria TaxID=6604 RepID=A0ABY7DU62_MYAAR|nr:hypothetical protein MAR_007831 [Mya arenaria]